MQNIDYLMSEIRAKNEKQIYYEKRYQHEEIIAESKVALIKLNAFAEEPPLLFREHTLSSLFLIFKIIQWAGAVFTIIWLPILVAKVEFFRLQTLESDSVRSLLRFGDSDYLTYFLVGVCFLIIGFLGAKFAKIQRHIESNKRIAHGLVEELQEHLYIAQKELR